MFQTNRKVANAGTEGNICISMSENNNHKEPHHAKLLRFFHEHLQTRNQNYRLTR